MKIETQVAKSCVVLNTPKEVADPKRVVMGGGAVTFRRVVLTAPKEVADPKRVVMGGGAVTFRRKG